MADPNRKFLLDEFKRCLSASGFRGFVSEIRDGYRVELEKDTNVAYPQLLKLAELTGTRKINFRVETSGFQGSELTPADPDNFYMEVTW